MILNEDLFEENEFEDFGQYADLAAAQSSIPNVETEVVSDSEIEPDGPDLGEDTGIANLIHDLIIGVNESIQNYNNAAANMEKYPELQKIMHNLAGEEFEHIGELQKALEIISPNAANIEEGEAESLYEDTKKKKNGKWVNKGEDGEHGEFRTKKEADAQRRAMFARGYKG